MITKADRKPGPGCNPAVGENGHGFPGQDGKEVEIEVLEVSPFMDENMRVPDECEITGGTQ